MPYSNLRKGRFSENGGIYFVTTATHQRIPFFQDFIIARELVGCMRVIQQEMNIEFLSWVIMPDHAHWLIQLQGKNSLAHVVNQLKGNSAYRLNKLLSRTGKFWQSNYHDHGLRKKDDIKKLARYIAANPLRAKLVKHIGEYPHWDSIWM